MRSIDINPQSAEAWCNKGNTLNELRKYDQALLASDKAVEINPQLAEAWNCKGIALKALGRTTEADSAFAKAKELGYKKADELITKYNK